MLKDITLGQYFPGRSYIHRLDPRTKILAVIAYIGSVFLAENYLAYAILTAFAAFVVLVSAIPFRLVLRSIKPLWIIVVLTLLIHVFSTPGNVLYHLGPLTATAEGVRQGIMMSLRLVLLITVSSLLTFTTSPISLTDGIERLLNPFRRLGLPAHELAMMMTIALRFIPTLLEEADRIMKAQMARGADFGSGNILKRAQSLIPLLVPLFISAFRRADELAVAMEARCYRGGENRTRMKELKISAGDWIAGGMLALLVAILFVLKYIVSINN
ncbi:MAG TPA: energy-coupling factor transporter transmembrane component T [Methylomusa anaerophila]|uniref:Energy-coupling factor transporter transmembrane protein EcfT n=1 Tax=Methylomusa anaerophila TaxID=1930071 RepID=A0A348AJZ4_9FIRM|nr:energy-coupling factor transporter transmembrane component T [Methylomusa anaerophila]BBB91392.1 energy-coupling factor transporter transmembrane protein EcfT [Methylomusa anaerophila]HML90184.1 energy-coupling factor transporter transmembrane component T [Methylomusa anaerophila]